MTESIKTTAIITLNRATGQLRVKLPEADKGTSLFNAIDCAFGRGSNGSLVHKDEILSTRIIHWPELDEQTEGCALELIVN